MPVIHALVAEDTAHLVHPLQPAHNEPLQRQLGGNAHVHVDIQGVVVGDEGPGGGTAGDGVQHWRLHLHIAPRVHKIPDMLDKLGADDEIPLHIRVHNEIHIPLAAPGLHIGEAMEFLRQGQQGLGQQGNGFRLDGDLAALGTKHLALHPHDIADIVLFEGCQRLLPHVIDTDIELNAAGAVLEVGKHRLTHAALAHQAAGQADGLPLHLLEAVLNLVAVVGNVKLGDDKRILPLLPQGGQLVPPDLEQLGQGGLLLNRLVVGLIRHDLLSFVIQRHPHLWMATTSYSIFPAGASTTATSPTALPSRALPKGDSSEMRPFMGSASWEPTT